MIAGVGVQKGEDLATRSGVDYLVYARQRNVILWTCLVESSIINAHSPFPGLFPDKDGIGELVGVENLPNEFGCQELGDLFAYDPLPLVVEMTQALLGRL